MFAARNFPHFTPREVAITREEPSTTAKNAASHGLDPNPPPLVPPLSIQSETGLEPRIITKNVGIHNAALKDGRRCNSRFNIQNENIMETKSATNANVLAPHTRLREEMPLGQFALRTEVLVIGDR